MPSCANEFLPTRFEPPRAGLRLYRVDMATGNEVTTWSADSTAAGFGALDRELWWRAGYRFIPAGLGLDTTGRTGTVLDVGCGSGEIATWLAREFDVDVLGVDTSPAMLARAEPADRVHYREVPPGDLPFEDGSVDSAFAAFVYVCEPDPDVLTRLTREVHRVVRPGGRFAVLDSNPDTTGVDFGGLRHGEPDVHYQAGDPLPVALRRADGGWMRIQDVYWPASTYVDLFRAAGFAGIAVHRPPDTTAAGETAAPFLLVTGTRPN